MDKVWKLIREIQDSLITTSVDSLDEQWIQMLSESTGVSTEYIHETMYRMLKMFLTNEGESLSYLDLIGKNRTVADDQFDADELTKGIELELLHISEAIKDEELGKTIAKELAKDNLSLIPDYYSREIAMRNEATPVTSSETQVTEETNEDPILGEIKDHVKDEIEIAEGIKILVVADEILKN